MNRKQITTLVVLVALVAAGVLIYQRSAKAETPEYRFATVERRDLRRTVSATGTLGAVTTVSVGTQVSGQIAELLVDFNDRVTKGQLLARIDPKLAQQAVTDAEATVERNRAQLIVSQKEHARNRELLDAGLVARSSFDTTQSSFAVAQANVKSAQVSLDRARQNLSYTAIHSPIDGVIVERNVDLGQTVAASLSAPQLFLIAEDLSRMQILVKVDESDIALIKQGQEATFTVQALTRETFRGVVKQVRLQSVVQENVVNYTVVIEVDNRANKLLPGMTASVDFEVATADDVLAVPNAALRFTPPVTEKRDATTATGTTGSTGSAGANGQRSGGGQRTRGARGGGRGAGNFGRLYVTDENGKLQAIRVRTGITDGTFTEVTGDELKEGMRIVAGLTQADTGAASSSQSPFGGQGGQGGGGPRPPGGF